MKKLVGGILLAIGILIAGASGLCSLAFTVLGLSEGSVDMLPLTLVVGGIPFAIGLGLFYLGRTIIRSANAEDPGKY